MNISLKAMPEFCHYQWTRFGSYSFFTEERMIFVNKPLDNDIFTTPEPQSDEEIMKMNMQALQKYFKDQQHWIEPGRLAELLKANEKDDLSKFRQIAIKAKKSREQELSLRATPHLSAEILDNYAKEINVIVEDLVKGYTALTAEMRLQIDNDLALNLDASIPEYEKLHKIARSMMKVEAQREVFKEVIESHIVATKKNIDTLTKEKKSKNNKKSGETKNNDSTENLKKLEAQLQTLQEKSGIIEQIVLKQIDSLKTELVKEYKNLKSESELKPEDYKQELIKLCKILVEKHEFDRAKFEDEAKTIISTLRGKNNWQDFVDDVDRERNKSFTVALKSLIKGKSEDIKIDTLIDEVYKSEFQAAREAIQKDPRYDDWIKGAQSKYRIAREKAYSLQVAKPDRTFVNEAVSDNDVIEKQKNILHDLVVKNQYVWDEYLQAARQALAITRGKKSWNAFIEKIKRKDIKFITPPPGNEFFLEEKKGYVPLERVYDKDVLNANTQLQQEITGLENLMKAVFDEAVSKTKTDKKNDIEARLKEQKEILKKYAAPEVLKDRRLKFEKKEKHLLGLLLQKNQFDKLKFESEASQELAKINGYTSWNDFADKDKKEAVKIHKLILATYATFEENRKSLQKISAGQRAKLEKVVAAENADVSLKKQIQDVDVFLRNPYNMLILKITGTQIPDIKERDKDKKKLQFAESELKNYQTIEGDFREKMKPLFALFNTYRKEPESDLDNVLAALAAAIQKNQKANMKAEFSILLNDLTRRVVIDFLKQDAKKNPNGLTDSKIPLSNADILILKDNNEDAAQKLAKKIGESVGEKWDQDGAAQKLEKDFEVIQNEIKDFDLKEWAQKFDESIPDGGKKFEAYLSEENAAVQLVAEIKQRETAKNAPKTEEVEEVEETPEIEKPPENRETAAATESAEMELSAVEMTGIQDLVDKKFKTACQPIFEALNAHCAVPSEYENFMEEGLTQEKFKTKLEELINEAVDGFMSATEEGGKIKRQKKLSQTEKFTLMNGDADAYAEKMKQDFVRYCADPKTMKSADVKNGFDDFEAEISKKFKEQVETPYQELLKLIPEADRVKYNFETLVAGEDSVAKIEEAAKEMQPLAIDNFFAKPDVITYVEFINAYDENYVTNLKAVLTSAVWRDLKLDSKLFMQEVDKMKKQMKDCTAAWMLHIPKEKQATYAFNDKEADPQKLFTKYKELFELACESLVDTYAEVLKIDGTDPDSKKLSLKSDFTKANSNFFEKSKLELDELKKEFSNNLADLAFAVGSSLDEESLDVLLSNADSYQKEWHKYTFFKCLKETQKRVVSVDTTWHDQFKEYANLLKVVDISAVDNEADKTAIHSWIKNLEELALSTDDAFGDLEKLHLKLNEIKPGLNVNFGFGSVNVIETELEARFAEIKSTVVELLDKTIHMKSPENFYDPDQFKTLNVSDLPTDMIGLEKLFTQLDAKFGRPTFDNSNFKFILNDWKNYLDPKDKKLAAEKIDVHTEALILWQEFDSSPDNPNWYKILTDMALAGNARAKAENEKLNPLGVGVVVPYMCQPFYLEAVKKVAKDDPVMEILLEKWQENNDNQSLIYRLQQLRKHCFEGKPQTIYQNEYDALPEQDVKINGKEVNLKETYAAYWRQQFYNLLPGLKQNYKEQSEVYNYLQTVLLEKGSDDCESIDKCIDPDAQKGVYEQSKSENEKYYAFFSNIQKINYYLVDYGGLFSPNESLLKLFKNKDLKNKLTGFSTKPDDFKMAYEKMIEGGGTGMTPGSTEAKLATIMGNNGADILYDLKAEATKRQKYKTYFENPERRLKLRRMKDSAILPRMRRVTKLYNMFGKKIEKYKTTTGALASSGVSIGASMLIAPGLVTGVGSIALSTVSMGLTAYGALLGLPIIGAATAIATVSGGVYQLKNKGVAGLMAPLDGLMQFSQGVGNMLSNSLGMLGAAKLKPMLNMLDSPIFTAEGNIDFSKMKEGDIDILDSIMDQWDQLEEGLEEAERLEKINTVDLEINTDKFGFEDDTLDGMMQSVYKDEFGFEPIKGLSDEEDKKKLIDMNTELDSIGQKYDINLVPHEGDAPELYRYLFRTKPAPGTKLSNSEWQKKEDEYFADIEAAIKKEKEALLMPFEKVMKMTSPEISKNIDKLIKEYDSKINRKNEEKKSYAELFGKAKSIDKEGMTTATAYTKSIEKEIDDLTQIKTKLDSIKEYLDHESKVQNIKLKRNKLLDKARKLELPKALNEAWSGLHTLEQEYSVLMQQVSQFPGGELSEEQQKELQELTEKMTEKAQKIEEQQATIGKVQKESGISGMGAMSDMECFLEVRSKLRNKFEDREKDISTWVNKKGEVSVDDIADPSKRKEVKLTRERRLIAMAKRCPELLTDHNVARAVFNLTLGKAVPNLIKNNQAYNLSNWAKSVKDQKFPLVSSTDQVKTFIKKGFSFLTRFVAKRSPAAAIVAADEIADRLNVQNWLGERYKNADYKETKLFWGAARLARYGLLDLPAKALPWLSFGAFGNIMDDRTPLIGLNASASYRKRAAAVENLHKFKARASHLKPKNAYPYPEAMMMNYLF